ncbi:VirB3 family type IV secretion system protein, partial [Klebsiella pneumoniae]|uniref:VirB3 family type IV secretion system protein n=1 Tax=Klebsiella pneumoniae TaxID=573 RepID=UPI0039C1DC9D
MAQLLKAMKRPAALWGVPMVPLLSVTGVTIIVAVWTSVALLFLLHVEFLVIKSLTRNEPMRFNLIAVCLRVKGKPVANRLLCATTLMPVEHDAVD